MSSAQLLAACFASLCCLMPVTFYLCWLASVNKKAHPTVVSGRWDFALVLAALSGFLLVGGTLLLTLVQSDTRFLMRGNFEQLREGWGQSAAAWLFVAVGYLALVIGVSAMTLTNRTRWLSVYGVDVPTAERAVEASLESSGIVGATRYGDRWANGPGLIELIPFRGMCHATIRLIADGPEMRAEIERHLRADLAVAPAADNAAAPWIGTLAGAGVLVNLCIVGLTLYVVFFR